MYPFLSKYFNSISYQTTDPGYLFPHAVVRAMGRKHVWKLTGESVGSGMRRTAGCTWIFLYIYPLSMMSHFKMGTIVGIFCGPPCLACKVNKSRMLTVFPIVSFGCSMDEGTLKTPIPKCSLYWLFFLGWWSNFVGSESVQKQSVKLLQNMVYNTTQHPPPQQPHTVWIYCAFSLGRGVGGGGGRSERR